MGTNPDSGVDSITLSDNPSQMLEFMNSGMLDKNKLKTIMQNPVTIQSVTEDVKYLHIIYYKWDRHESISSSQNMHIDYVNAISEMENLDWTFVYNHIGFVNKRKAITIQFVKLDSEKWYVEELINSGVTWDGYVWYAETDNSHLYDLLWWFYHEEPFAMAVPGWKVKRVEQ